MIVVFTTISKHFVWRLWSLFCVLVEIWIMHRLFLDIGGFSIYWYGVMMMLGFLAGWAVWIILGRERGYEKNVCSDLLFWVIVAGLLGARAAYVIENWEQYSDNLGSILAFREGGVVFYGGFLGAILSLVVYSRIKHLRLLSLLDLTTTGLPVAHALGRIGCFLNGCCYGSRTDGPLGVCYPRYSFPWSMQVDAQAITRYDLKTLPLHAVQLYEAAANLAIFAIIVIVYRRARRPGMTAGIYALLYAVARLGLEHFRGDRGERAAVGPFSIAQVISFGVALGGVALILAGRRSTREVR
jgi:phosphatidylglycerol:prolipoprotein diacylglycerol transferase